MAKLSIFMAFLKMVLLTICGKLASLLTTSTFVETQLKPAMATMMQSQFKLMIEACVQVDLGDTKHMPNISTKMIILKE